MKISKDLIVVNCMIFFSTGITAVYGFYNIIKLQCTGNLNFLFRVSDYEGIYNILNYSLIVALFVVSMGIFSLKGKFRKLMQIILLCMMLFNSFDFVFKKMFYMGEQESFALYLIDFLFSLGLVFYFNTERIKDQFKA